MLKNQVICHTRSQLSHITNQHQNTKSITKQYSKIIQQTTIIMNQTIGIKICKETSQNWTKQHKIQTISPCIFSNNFQHTKLTRNNPKSFNKNCNKNSPNFTSLSSRFFNKEYKKSIKPRQNNSLVFLDQSWHAIYQNWSKYTRKIIGIFLEFFKEILGMQRCI